MKKLVKNKKERELEIIIDFYYDFDDRIEACFHPDLNQFDLDQVIEETIEDYYTTFMEQVADKFVSMGFEILEGPDFSNRKGSKSCYFVVCNKNEYDSLTVKLIMNIRISDHRLSKRKGENKSNNRFQARNAYYQRELEHYRELNETNPEDIDFGLMEIIISGQKFKTYREAINYIANYVKKEMPV